MDAFRPVLVELPSGRTRLLPELDIEISPRKPRLSPDGEYLLWVRRVGRGYRWKAARVDGSWSREWPGVEVPPVLIDAACWAQDSQRWVVMREARGRTSFQVYPLRSAGPSKRVSLKLPAYLGSPLRLLPHDRLLIQGWEGDSFTEVLLDPTRPRVERFRPTLPQGAVVMAVALSQDGSQLAWMLAFEHTRGASTPPSASPIERWSAPSWESLWIGNARGSGMREIGRVQQWPGTTRQVDGLTWTPDGHCLSFGYDRAIWAVPVEAAAARAVDRSYGSKSAPEFNRVTAGGR